MLKRILVALTACSLLALAQPTGAVAAEPAAKCRSGHLFDKRTKKCVSFKEFSKIIATDPSQCVSEGSGLRSSCLLGCRDLADPVAGAGCSGDAYEQRRRDFG